MVRVRGVLQRVFGGRVSEGRSKRRPPPAPAPRTFSRKLGKAERAGLNEYAIRFSCYNCKKENRLAVKRGASARGVLEEHQCWFCGINLGNGSGLMSDPVAE